MTSDRPVMASPEAPANDTPHAPSQDSAPPLAPEPGQSPWWSAPAGKPFSIPDFAHEFAALFASLFVAPQPIPLLRVKARRR